MNANFEMVTSTALEPGHGQDRNRRLGPSDGEVVEGVAFVNEAAITGESAPVLKEPGTDIRSSVTGGTTVVSDWLVVRITANPGETFLDRMIALVEGANRQKTPNEIALSLLLTGLTISSCFVVCVALFPVTTYAAADPIVLVALFVTLIPTTIGGLLSAIGIAGMDRVTRFNVLASPVAPSKPPATGTRCCSTRPARSRSATGWRPSSARCAAEYRSWSWQRQRPGPPYADETPEGRSIVALAKEKGVTGEAVPGDEFVPFSASTRLSGVRYTGGETWKGAERTAIRNLAPDAPAALPRIWLSERPVGGTPWVAANGTALGVSTLLTSSNAASASASSYCADWESRRS